MCFVSAVFDQFKPYTPQPNQWQTPFTVPVTVPGTAPLPGFAWPTQPTWTEADLREFIDAFHKAVEAAKVFDRLTGQPDCADPEKAELEERIAALEARLAELEKP